MLILTHVSLATVEELFRYKANGFSLEEFPGYSDDQWGIKAHNRPWIEEVGQFQGGHKIVEVGGAFSLLPKYLSDKFGLEAWIADDFGKSSGEMIWSRWGNPHELPEKYPSVKYTFENFGSFSEKHPTEYFDRIFTVSTLEHIPQNERINVLKDMHRCLKHGGRQLHTIDIEIPAMHMSMLTLLVDRFKIGRMIFNKYKSEIIRWVELFEQSGIKVQASIPSATILFDRKTLVESPDVVYRLYPPNNSPKPYCPAASLLLVIEDL